MNRAVLKQADAQVSAATIDPAAPRVTFLTVMPSPYIQDLFSRLSRLVALRVLYLETEAPDTHWGDVQCPEYAEVLPGRWWGAGGVRVHVNPTVVERLADSPSDLYVVAGYLGWTQQRAMRWLVRERKPWAFWGEVPGMRRRGKVGVWLRRLAQRPIRDACAVAAIGRRAAEAYRELAPAALIHNLPYFCDLQPFRDAAASTRGRDLASFRLLYCGQLIQRKGVDVLLRAFADFAGRHAEAELVLVGDGPLRSELEKQAEPLDGRVTFAGFVPVDQLPTWFAAADVFVLPSRHDGWGVVVNQALGAGLPVVATTAVGAAIDLIRDGVNGALVPPDDSDALQRVWEAYLRDPRSLAESRTAALATAAHVDLEAGAQRWMNFIRAAIDHCHDSRSAALSQS